MAHSLSPSKNFVSSAPREKTQVNSNGATRIDGCRVDRASRRTVRLLRPTRFSRGTEIRGGSAWRGCAVEERGSTGRKMARGDFESCSEKRRNLDGPVVEQEIVTLIFLSVSLY